MTSFLKTVTAVAAAVAVAAALVTRNKQLRLLRLTRFAVKIQAQVRRRLATLRAETIRATKSRVVVPATAAVAVVPPPAVVVIAKKDRRVSFSTHDEVHYYFPAPALTHKQFLHAHNKQKKIFSLSVDCDNMCRVLGGQKRCESIPRGQAWRASFYK